MRAINGKYHWTNMEVFEIFFPDADDATAAAAEALASIDGKCSDIALTVETVGEGHQVRVEYIS